MFIVKNERNNFPANPHAGVTYYISGIPYIWNCFTGWCKDDS